MPSGMMAQAQEIARAAFGMPALWIATTILIATYVAVATDRLDRVVVAGLGACLMIVLGVLDQGEAIAGVDFNTIMLLAGMMLIVGVSRRSGMFQYIALRTTQLTRASPAGVLLAMAMVTGIMSALLDNVTTVLLVAPVTLAITAELDVPPYPFLVAEVLASNVGGTATLVGDPPNIIIGSAAGYTFNDFLVNLGPVVLVILVVNALILHAIWGRKLRSDIEHEKRVMAMNAPDAIKDPRLLKQSLTVLAIVIVAFLFARRIQLESGTIAMMGSVLLVMLDNWHRSGEEQADRIHRSFGEIEWITLFFFIGLFVIVEGARKAGLIDLLTTWVLDVTGGKPDATVVMILWSAALLSTVLDNIPFVATLVPLIIGLAPTVGADLDPLWWSLSLGACLGGSGTLIGAGANLTVAGIAERSGVPFSFGRYMRVAFPIMLVNVGIAHLYLWVRFLR